MADTEDRQESTKTWQSDVDILAEFCRERKKNKKKQKN